MSVCVHAIYRKRIVIIVRDGRNTYIWHPVRVVGVMLLVIIHGGKYRSCPAIK